MAIHYTRRLPANFPKRLSVCLRERVYDHKRQLWADFRYDGDRFNIVVDDSELLPQPGEKWELQPRFSPNGHIVFCWPIRRLRAA